MRRNEAVDRTPSGPVQFSRTRRIHAAQRNDWQWRALRQDVKPMNAKRLGSWMGSCCEYGRQEQGHGTKPDRLIHLRCIMRSGQPWRVDDRGIRTIDKFFAPPFTARYGECVTMRACDMCQCVEPGPTLPIWQVIVAIDEAGSLRKRSQCFLKICIVARIRQQPDQW